MVCVLIPLVGIAYAMRMILLSLLPEKFSGDQSTYACTESVTANAESQHRQ